MGSANQQSLNPRRISCKGTPGTAPSGSSTTLTSRHNGRFAGPETRFFGIEAASDIDRGELFVANINEALGLTQDTVSLANEEP